MQGGAYAILTIEEFEELEKARAKIQLMAELEKGRLAGESEGWISEGYIQSHFAERINRIG